MKRRVVNSPVGQVELDRFGSAIGSGRINPEAVMDIPFLLKDVIDNQSATSWIKIVDKINNLYTGVSSSLDALENETKLSDDIMRRVHLGQKLFFKPNIVSPSCIDRVTHGPGMGSLAACTNWYFVAALMRWFHDILGISYHQMSLGEGGTTMSATAAAYTISLQGKGKVTTQALLEGKWGDYYGGWGFYFVRKYLADTHSEGHADDPMSGFEESLSGQCIPPGRSDKQLLIYDINKIDDNLNNGRLVSVPHGINFDSIVLHKAVVGGNPSNNEDIKDWPGCILINVPRLKIHNLEIITCALKNLGIGLYPMEAQDKSFGQQVHWKYAHPHKFNPALKSGVPHSVWIAEIEEDTGLPKLGSRGVPIVRKTGGLSGTMADVIEAVKEQDIMMLHVVDAIAPTSRYHAGGGILPIPEGYSFASLDPVAVDLLCARYIFTTVPMQQAQTMQQNKKRPTDFYQKVPIPTSISSSIVSTEGFDSPVSRYAGFAYCQERGLGTTGYFVSGKDVWHATELASIKGHLGQIKDNNFSELLTHEMYFASTKPLIDLQQTVLAYVKANDELTGSKYLDFVVQFDENGDGVMDYDEKFKYRTTHFMSHGSRLQSVVISQPDRLKTRFLLTAVLMRCNKKEWNPLGYDFNNWEDFNLAVASAITMSTSPIERYDAFVSGLIFGKGKWPSIQFAEWQHTCSQLYGTRFPTGFDITSLYGIAFQYADYRFNNSSRTIPINVEAIMRYHKEVENGHAQLLFTIYVPPGYGILEDKQIFNVEETVDPGLIFTASFGNNAETWRELSLSSIP